MDKEFNEIMTEFHSECLRANASTSDQYANIAAVMVCQERAKVEHQFRTFLEKVQTLITHEIAALHNAP